MAGFQPSPEVQIQLDALERQAQADDLEYIVVDDGSADRVASWLLRGHGGIDVRILRNASRIGPSMSRNRGWQTARGRYIVFLDPDMVPAPGWLDAYRRSIQSNADIVLGMTCARNGRTTREIPVPSPTACFTRSNVLISRDLVTAAGGYAPFLLHSYDFDLGFRIAELNPAVTTAEHAIVYVVSPEQSCQWTHGERRAFLSRNPRRSAVLIDLWLHSPPAVTGQALELFPHSPAEVAALESVPSSAAWHRLIAAAPPDELLASFNLTTDQIVGHLSELAGASRVTVNDYITDAVAHGLLVREGGEQLYFDLFHTLNWLRVKTLYLDDEIRNSSFARTHPTPRQCNPVGAAPVSVRCRGRYTLDLDPAWQFSCRTPV